MTNGSKRQDSHAVTRILDLSRLDPERLRELERFRRPIAVLFADIVGSTAYFEKFGDISGLAMVHNFKHLVGKAVEEHSGRVIKNIGDGIMATFEETEPGVRASIEIQRRLQQANASIDDGHRFAVRIGLHYGSAIVRSDSDVFGDVVNVHLAFKASLNRGRSSYPIPRGGRSPIFPIGSAGWDSSTCRARAKSAICSRCSGPTMAPTETNRWASGLAI